MTKFILPLKFYKLCAVAILIVFTGVSCLPAADVPSPTPLLQTVEVTRQVTRAVTQEVTREVTRIVEVQIPVTVTPTPTSTFTPSITPTVTRTPTSTRTPLPPRVTILDHAACWFGPGDAYLIRYGLNATSWMNVTGRNTEGTWLLLNDGGHDNPCWIRIYESKFIGGGDVYSNNIPIVDPDVVLPGAYNLYRPPTSIQTIRAGNKVTIYWNAVWMTEDDYEGYLIEAHLCKDGQLVFMPIKHKPPLSENLGLLGIIINDEPGCLVPSSARIYTVEKHGYTEYRMIPWPPF